MPDVARHIIIVGPRNELYLPALSGAIRKGCLIIGDGENPVTQEVINETLKQNDVISDQNTHIHYWGHGNWSNQWAQEGEHFINMDGEARPTQDVLGWNRDIPGIRHIWSCHAGAAKYISESFPMILHSGKKYSTLATMNAEGIREFIQFFQDFQVDAPTAFEYFVSTSPETALYVESISGEVRSFRGSAPKHPVPATDIKRYVEEKRQEFQQFRIEKLNHKGQEFVPIGEFLPKTGYEIYCDRALKIEISRGNKAYALQHLEWEKTEGYEGLHALHLACKYGSVDVIHGLLEKGADVNQYDKNGDFPLYYACINKHIEVTALLLENHAEIDKKSSNGMTSLHYASTLQNTELMEVLLKYHPTIDLQDSRGLTALHYACVKNDPAMARLLLEAGAGCNVRDGNGYTPLFYAAGKGFPEVVRVLMEYGADPDKAMTKGNKTLIEIVEAKNYREIAEMLSERKEPVQQQEEGQKSWRKHVEEGRARSNTPDILPGN